MLIFTECKEENFCKDCKNKECLHSGKIMADCPLYDCKNDKIHDCEHCEFIQKYYASFKERLLKNKRSIYE